MRAAQTGALLCLAVLSMTASAQVVVYDNTTTSLDNNFPLLPEWRDDSGEAGDDVWLDGTARQVTQLSIILNYRGTEPGTWDGQIRFRDLDELDQTPSTILYDSGVIEGLPMVHGLNTYTFDIPNVLVPTHVVWTVQAYNRQGLVGEMGPAYFNPPTVGFSDDFFWLSDQGSPWTQYSWGGEPVANFAATIKAVPEPASFAVLGLGFLLLRKRRN